MTVKTLPRIDALKEIRNAPVNSKFGVFVSTSKQQTAVLISKKKMLKLIENCEEVQFYIYVYDVHYPKPGKQTYYYVG